MGARAWGQNEGNGFVGGAGPGRFRGHTQGRPSQTGPGLQLTDADPSPAIFGSRRAPRDKGGEPVVQTHELRARPGREGRPRPPTACSPSPGPGWARPPREGAGRASGPRGRGAVHGAGAPRAPSPLVVGGEDAAARRVVAVLGLPGAGGAALVLAVGGGGRHGAAGESASPGRRLGPRKRAQAGLRRGRNLREQRQRADLSIRAAR